MAKDKFNFTTFFDETGCITNDRPEIFGGSLFIVEDSEIDECRTFLNQHYPNGIHCNKIRSGNKLSRIAKDVGDFLKDKNCCAVSLIQINKDLIEECKESFIKKYNLQPTGKDLSFIKRMYCYSMIPRFSIKGVYSLIKNKPVRKTTIKLFMENVKRDKKLDRWDLYLVGSEKACFMSKNGSKTGDFSTV